MPLQQLGTTCLINGVNAFTSFKADLKDRFVESNILTRNLSHYVGGHKLLRGYESYELGSMTLTFYVYGEATATEKARTVSEKNANLLVVAMNDCILSFDDDDFEYPSCLSEYTILNSGIDNWSIVTIKVYCIKRLPIINTTNGNIISPNKFQITNSGSIKSGLKLTVTTNNVTFSMTDETENEITCSGLSVGGTLIIDGFEGTVTLNGENIFNKTNIYNFPVIVPGVNNLMFSSPNVAIQYYQVFYV